MKKIFAFLLAAVMLTLCFTGCVYEDLTVELNKDETGSISATIGIEKSFAGQMMGARDPFEGKETKEVEYDGKTYITYTETEEYDSFEKIAAALTDMTYDTESIDNYTVAENGVVAEGVLKNNHIFKSAEIKKDGSRYVFEAVLNKIEGQVQDYDMSDVFKIGITVKMPAKITAYKNGTVDGRSVTFNISDISEETELYAECKAASIVPVIICGVLVVGSVMAFFIIKKRK